MALDMRALYYVALPTERSEADDVQRHEEDIKANENCLNQNFSALAQKIYEFEARIALLEAAAASNAGKTDTGVERDRKSTRLNSSHRHTSRMPSSA